jgi:hypothetical protein
LKKIARVIKMKTALVLFCGTKSIDRSLEAEGFYVQSLDMDPKCNPTWTANILEWEAWKDIEPGTLDFIWASPPCVQYSRARTTAKTPRDLAGADRIVYRTLEIITYLRPKAYLIENPQTGMLKDRVVLSHTIFRDVCYCRYSDGEKHTYRKPTRLWGWLPTFEPRPMCTRKDPCEFSRTGKHPTCAQRFCPGSAKHRHTLSELYSMPKALCDEIANAASRYVEALSD